MKRNAGSVWACGDHYARLISDRPGSVFAFFVAMFLLRLVLAGGLLFPSDPAAALGTDGWGKVAWNLIQGNGYVVNAGEELNLTKNPLPVLYYAGLFWLFGKSIWAVIIGNCLVDVGTGYLLYRVTRLLLPSMAFVAVLAVTGWVLYVPAIYYSVRAMSEPLFTIFLTAHIYSLLVLLRRPTVRAGIVCGLLLGGAVMCRTTVQLWLVVVWALLLVPPRLLGIDRGRTFAVRGALVAVTLAYVAAMVPWTVRNYVDFDRIILSNAPLGSLLYKNTALLDRPGIPQVAGLENEMNEILRAQLASRGQPYPEDGVERARVEQELAIEKIREYPGRYALLVGYQFIRLWFNLGYDTRPSMQSYLVAAMNAVLIILAVAAFLVSREPWRIESIPIVLLIGYFTGVHILTHSVVRYIVPVIPYMVMFSAIAIAHIVARYAESGGADRHMSRRYAA